MSELRSNNLFGERNHFAELIQQATAPVRQYQKVKARKMFKPEYARFKLKFYYRDKNGQPMFSYDTYKRSVDGKKFSVTDEREGLVKLMREVRKQQLADTFTSAMIWCTLASEKSTQSSAYNFAVAKFVRNKPDWFYPRIEFNNGILILSNLIQLP